MKFDLVIFGGGTSGIASAYIAAKYGLNTLVVEHSDVLGGNITQTQVIPVMKTNNENINTEYFNDLLNFADKYNARHKYIDGNEAWFNPELLKIVFDDMLSSVNCNILFSSDAINAKYDNDNKLFEIKIVHNGLSLYIESKYIIDATANAQIFKLLNCKFQNFDERKQAAGLRFVITNIDMNKFASFLLDTDDDRNVTSVEYTDSMIYLSTACTNDKNINWALSPIFEQAVKDGVLEYEDTAYFQVFSIAQMPTSLSFNCPRIILEDYEDLNDPFVYSKALKQGRERIYRIYLFCKKYFPGFENCYISHISDMLGIRESCRIQGKYTYTKEDIISGKKPKNVALACDYPIDIHSTNKKDKLEYINHTYYLPVEALISEEYDNLYGVGKILSADFEAQAALRTQMSCFSMGEAAAKDIIKKINN